METAAKRSHSLSEMETALQRVRSLHSAAYAVKSKTGNAEEEKLMLKTGVHCQVLTGKLEGQYGTVSAE